MAGSLFFPFFLATLGLAPKIQRSAGDSWGVTGRPTGWLRASTERVTAALPSRRDPSGCARMGNSALRAHVETAQKTGVFQLKDRGLTEVRLGGTRPGSLKGGSAGTVKLIREGFFAL